MAPSLQIHYDRDRRTAISHVHRKRPGFGQRWIVVRRRASLISFTGRNGGVNRYFFVHRKSILRRPFNVVDHENARRNTLRFQLQSQLFLKGSKNGGSRNVIIAFGKRQSKTVTSAEARHIDNWPPKLRRKDSSQPFHWRAICANPPRIGPNATPNLSVTGLYFRPAFR